MPLAREREETSNWKHTSPASPVEDVTNMTFLGRSTLNSTEELNLIHSRWKMERGGCSNQVHEPALNKSHPFRMQVLKFTFII